ncbi:MAG: phosphate uptake regulator PhoU [archaeon]
MELRKIQKTGGSTYIISLPKSWAQKENLTQGSVLSIEEQRDGSLRLSPKISGEKETQEIEIIADENLRRRMLSKYLLGYDVLLIKSETKLTKNQKSEIKKNVQHMIGFEILEESANEMRIKSLLDPNEVSIHKSLRRMYSIVSVMHRDLIIAIETTDQKLLRDIIQRDVEVNKLYFLLVRQIRTVIQNARLQEKENITAVDCVDYRLVASVMERLGDSLESIATTLLKETPEPRLKKMIESTYEIHNTAATAIFKRDEKLAKEAHLKWQKFSPTGLRNQNISNELVKIADFGNDLADIVAGD